MDDQKLKQLEKRIANLEAQNKELVKQIAKNRQHSVQLETRSRRLYSTIQNIETQIRSILATFSRLK